MATVVALALVASAALPARGGAGGGVEVHRACADLLASGRTTSLSQVRDRIGAPASGPTGAGVGVALVDTGIARVAGLAGDGKVVAGPDLSEDGSAAPPGPRDRYGHGTHLAAIVAGAGSASGRGVAPGAHLVDVKVGGGGAVDTSRVIAGIDWVVRNRTRLDVRVLLVTVAGDARSPDALALARAVERARAAGLLVVAAAGNEGASAAGLASPAVSPAVIATGATTRAGDDVATWSAVGDDARAPDVVAPGTRILSVGAPDSTLAAAHPTATCVDVDGALLLRGSGTSQSAAVVAGAAAVLLEQRPHLRPDQVVRLLTSTARPVDAPRSHAGHGRVDLAAALAAATPDGVEGRTRRAPAGVRSSDHGAAPLDATWSGATWSGATWSGATWSGATWSGATWSGASWE